MKEVKNLLTVKDDKTKTAKIYIYGEIGRSWWDDKKDQYTGGAEFVTEANNLVKDGFTKIDVHLNSVGGSILEGKPICNWIQNATIDVETHNDGLAASMGAMIWLSAKEGKRHMNANSLLMLHGLSSGVWGSIPSMKEQIADLGILEISMKAMLKENTSFTDEEIETVFNGKDHWYTADDCIAKGFISEKTASIKPPTQISNITKSSLLQKLHLATNKIQTNTIMADKPDYSQEIADLKQEIASLKTSIEEAKNTKPDPTPNPDPVVDPKDPEVENLKKELETLKGELASFKKAPSVDPAPAAFSNDGNGDGQKDELDEFNESLLASQNNIKRFS